MEREKQKLRARQKGEREKKKMNDGKRQKSDSQTFLAVMPE